MRTGRLEAFSDGVLAIAITLLVLDLHIPAYRHGHLWSALVHEWPQFAAYVVSFLIIGVIWLNHHSLIQSIRHVDRTFLMLNLLLLLTVALIPFPTALVAQVIGSGGDDAKAAAAIYAGSMELMAMATVALWFWASRDNGRLLKEPIEPMKWRITAIRFCLGHIPYLLSLVLAFINPWVSLALIFLTAAYYAFDQLAHDQLSQIEEPEHV